MQVSIFGLSHFGRVVKAVLEIILRVLKCILIIITKAIIIITRLGKRGENEQWESAETGGNQ